MERFSNINTILAFVTVAQEGSVSRAADILNLTQPAISLQIKRLSQETGITLFQRTATGLMMTQDGAAVLQKAKSVLQAMREFRSSVSQQANHVAGILRIGTIIDPEFIRLGRLLSQLGADYPNITTELVHGVSGDTLERLKREQIDAGFHLNAPGQVIRAGPDDPIHTVALASFSYRVIAPVGWEKRVENATWAELALLPWIGTPEISFHHKLLLDIFTKINVQQNVVALVDQEASMLEMVRAGIGLSLCRESIALHQRQSFGLVVSDKLSVPACLSIATLERRKDNPIISALFNQLQSTW
jgi:DNA-binding transcriptional LysR family regulator